MLLAACKATSADKPDAAPGTLSAPPQVQRDIRIAYPPNATLIGASSTYIAGALPAGKQLTCNGDPVKTNDKGYFAQVVQLKPGPNTFKLAEVGDASQIVELTVNREHSVPQISAGKFELSAESAQPHEDRGVVAGDMIQFKVRATPASSVKVQLGRHVIELRAASEIKAVMRHKALPPNVNLGLDATYGKVFQRWPSSAPDTYLGFYKVAPDDQFQNIQPRFTLVNGDRSTSVVSQARISTIAQPILAQTRNDDTVVRVGPGAGRITPLAAGVRLLIDGWQGDSLRCIYSPTQHVWIKKDDLVFESENGESGPVPQSVIRTINVLSDNYGASIVMPLTQRLPYQIEQYLKPNRLVIKLYGVTSDTDWITPIVPSAQEKELVERVAWKQVADDVYEATIFLKQSRQWGFKADYDGTTLRLHIKHAPNVVAGKTSKRLEGLSICLDPGHGGNETGAIGCGGMTEAAINLGIAMKLKDLLEHEGARVVMTRTTNVDVSLGQRVEIANQSDVDILLSVHNNALPDGRDPWAEHGTSSYWYHPQSTELAHALKSGIEHHLAFGDLATRWQNLALTRPTAMLATLTESGFMVNPDEYAILEEPAGQQKAAQGMLDGLIDYLGVGETK
jgi:N-acetylmuramoyl-L-alanine amidase